MYLSETCWAIHTRDYKVNDPQNCQILVTVPEMLAIMLLSPPLAKSWVPRIKRCVRDTTRYMLTLQSCLSVVSFSMRYTALDSKKAVRSGSRLSCSLRVPSCGQRSSTSAVHTDTGSHSGLSATIGQPEAFNIWLESVQRAHGYQHTFIDHKHRYSHLRKFHYAMQATTPESFAGLAGYQDTGRLRFLHPVSTLGFGSRHLPPDFSLEAADCLSLYHALTRVKQHVDAKILHDLEPKRFFSEAVLMKQKDVIAYEAQLKTALTHIIDVSDPQDDFSALSQVIQALHGSGSDAQSVAYDKGTRAPRALANLIFLVSDLHANRDLVSLVLSWTLCVCLALIA